MYDNLPVLYAEDATTGDLRFIDDVPNGEACGCICPSCGQPMVAKNGGSIMVHHFAHKGGCNCKWALEAAVTQLACDIINKRRRFVFPALTYYDYRTRGFEEIVPSQSVFVSRAHLEYVTVRDAPEIILEVPAKNGVRKFVLIIPIVHEVDEDDKDELREYDEDVIILDLQRCLKKKEANLKYDEGRCYDREELLELVQQYQNEKHLGGFITGAKPYYKHWLINAKAEEKYEEAYEAYQRSKLEQEAAEQKHLQQEAEAQEQQRKEEEHARRLREEAAEKQRMEQLVLLQEKQARDKWGHRWVMCISCGEVMLEDEFQTYGGEGRANLGVCYNCYKGGVRWQ